MSKNRICKQDHNSEVSTTYLQQWDSLEESNKEHEEILSSTIIDTIIFSKYLRKQSHAVIILINDKEYFTSNHYDLVKLTQQSNVTKITFNKHDNNLTPNTYKRRSQGINFFFTPRIEEYIVRCGVIPFDLFSYSDHRGVYLDINILCFLKDSVINPPTND